MPVGVREVFLCLTPREIRCATHGRIEEDIPRAESGARVTLRYEYLMLRASA